MKALKDSLILVVIVVLLTSVRITVPADQAALATDPSESEKPRVASVSPVSRAASPDVSSDTNPAPDEARSTRILMRIEWQGRPAAVVVPEIPELLQEVGERAGLRFETHG